MADYMPPSLNGAEGFTLTTGATAVVGGNVLDMNADDTVIPCNGTLHPVGVAAHDGAVGQRVAIFDCVGILHETSVASGVGIVAGAPVVPATNSPGRISTGTLATVAAAGTLLGVCIRGATGNSLGGAKARWIGVA